MVTGQANVLIVGAGSIGERHLRCFQLTGRACVAVCETNVSTRERVAAQYGVCAFASLEEAMRSNFDAVVIAAPAPSHLPLAMRAAENGMHLLIEKPLSVSNDMVCELMEVTKQRKLTAAVAYVMRNHPALAAARTAIQAGQFGNPLQIVSVSGQNFPYYRPAYRDTYYADRSSGGGAIQDALTHMVNAVEWLVGPTDQVLADADHLSLAGVEVEDTVHVLARNGRVLVNYALNQHQAPYENTITIVCEHGTVRVWLDSHRWGYQLEPSASWIEQSFEGLQRDDLFIRQANNFLDAVDGKTKPLCSLLEGAATLNVNLAILNAVANPPWTSVEKVSATDPSEFPGVDLTNCI